MRAIAYIIPTFWTRGSGKALRGDPVAQALALYLMTAPSSNMIGLYYLPCTTLLHETGLTYEQLKATLPKIRELAQYDEESGIVWVPESAKYQIGETLSPRDKKRSAIQRDLNLAGNHGFAHDFMRRYGVAYGLLDANSASEIGGAPEGASAVDDAPLPLPSPPLLSGSGSQRSDQEPPDRSGTHAVVDPTSLDSALLLPIRERCAYVLRKPDMAQWVQPDRWPEIIAGAAAAAAALRFTPNLGTYARDSGVRALVELFAAGYSPDDFARMAKAAATAKYFQEKHRRSLSAFTPEVARILLAECDAAANGEPAPGDGVKRHQARVEADRAAQRLRDAAEAKRMGASPSEIKDAVKGILGAVGNG